MNNLEIKAILESQIPAIEESFKSQIQYQFDRIAKVYQVGVPGGFRGIYNDARFGRIWTGLRDFVEREYGTDATRTNFTGLNTEKVAKAAKEYATAAALEWYSKIMEKVGELEDASAKSINGSQFVITGSRNGVQVEIDQQMIVNCSVNGILFNQYPARIYVAGKATSAAKYKKMFESNLFCEF